MSTSNSVSRGWRLRRNARLVPAGGLLALAFIPLLTGCHRQRQTADGNMASAGQPSSVDNSWVNAARSCWPELAKNGYSTHDISGNLIHHLGSAFPTYGALSSSTGDADLSMPITTVLSPDASKLEHSQTPILTRGQAVAGTPPAGALVANTNGNAPPDALCSIQSGIPQGFSK